MTTIELIQMAHNSAGSLASLIETIREAAGDLDLDRPAVAVEAAEGISLATDAFVLYAGVLRDCLADPGVSQALTRATPIRVGDGKRQVVYGTFHHAVLGEAICLANWMSVILAARETGEFDFQDGDIRDGEFLRGQPFDVALNSALDSIGSPEFWQRIEYELRRESLAAVGRLGTSSCDD